MSEENIEKVEKQEVSDIRYEKGIVYDEALTLTKFGKFNYIIIIVSGVCLTTVFLETLGISFVLPVAQCDLKLTTQDKGSLSSIAFAGIITSSHLWGFLADTKGRRAVILPTLMAAFAITILSSLTTNFWIFAILRYFAGFFISGTSATVYAYLGEFHNSKNRTRSIMGASFVFGMGCMTLPLLAWLVINQTWQFYIPVLDVVYKPWRFFLVVCGFPSFLCGLALLKIPESPKFVLCQGKQEETMKILQRIYKINTGKDENDLKFSKILEEPDDQQVRERSSRIANSKGGFQTIKLMWKQTAPLFMSPYLNKTIIGCLLQFGIFATSNGMYMFFPEILNRMADWNDQHPDNSTTLCNMLYHTQVDLTKNTTLLDHQHNLCEDQLDISTYEHSLVVEIGYALGFAVIGSIINTIGKLPILVFILCGCGICALAMVFVDTPMLAIYLYLILLMCGLAIPVANSATVDQFPTNLRAMAVCISLMFGRLGSAVGSNIVGVLLDTNCEATFLMSGLSLCACGVLSFFIPNIFNRYKNPIPPRISVNSRTSAVHFD